MVAVKRHVIICEGKSEVVYIERLQSFLDQQPLRQGVFETPLRFIPKPNPNGVGGGKYSQAVAKYKKEKGSSLRTNVAVWVDYDLYHRNYKNTQSSYSSRGGVPAFNFSFHNFEDFLILHYSPVVVAKWRSVFTQTPHIHAPLHSEVYIPNFLQVFPNYKKGDVPLDIVNQEGFRNLKQNLSCRPISPHSNNSEFRDFATFLLDELDNAYPGLI